jgi:hypothetical protein
MLNIEILLKFNLKILLDAIVKENKFDFKNWLKENKIECNYNFIRDWINEEDNTFNNDADII